MGKLSVEKLKKISYAQRCPMRETVYQQLRKAIIRGHYKPNDNLREEDLAKQLGVSRTPVREALRKLESESLVTYYPHRGTVVSEISNDEIDELFAVRTLIEALIARRAAAKATAADIKKLKLCLERAESSDDPDDILNEIETFNETIFQISDAERLTDLGKRIREHLQRLLVSNHPDPDRRAAAAAEHMRIVEALEANDSDLAEKLTREHLTKVPRLQRG